MNDVTISTIGGLVNNTKQKTIPVIGDMLPLMDSQDKNLIKKISIGDIQTMTSNQTTVIVNAMTPDIVNSIYTATDVLDKLKTVDGAGSGLDADLLDGKHASSFLELTEDGNIPIVDTRSVDTPTDLGWRGVKFEFKGNATDGLADGGTYHSIVTIQQWQDSSGGKTHQLGLTDNGNLYHRTGTIGGTWGTWEKMWSDANDGSGSGLDADTVDGLHASSFPSTTGFNMTGGIRGQLGTGAIGVGSAGTPSFEAYAEGANASYMNFHRSGAWAVRFGLDTDNKLKVGGFSMGTNAYEMWHAGNLSTMLAHVYPVGAIYISTVSTSPATLFGFGTWTAIAGRFLIGADGTYPAGTTGGGATHVHSMQAHTHDSGTLSAGISPTSGAFLFDEVARSFTSDKSFNVSGASVSTSSSSRSTAVDVFGATTAPSTANTGSGSSLPPYLSVYIWQRTA